MKIFIALNELTLSDTQLFPVSTNLDLIEMFIICSYSNNTII